MGNASSALRASTTKVRPATSYYCAQRKPIDLVRLHAKELGRLALPVAILLQEVMNGTYGWHRPTCRIYLGKFARAWGIAPRTAASAARELERIVGIQRGDTDQDGTEFRLPDDLYKVVELDEARQAASGTHRSSDRHDGATSVWHDGATPPTSQRPVHRPPQARKNIEQERSGCLSSTDSQQGTRARARTPAETVRQSVQEQLEAFEKLNPVEQDAIDSFSLGVWQVWTDQSLNTGEQMGLGDPLPLGPKLERIQSQDRDETTRRVEVALRPFSTACYQAALFTDEDGMATSAAIDLGKLVRENPFYSGKVVHPHHFGREVRREPWAAWLQWLIGGRDGYLAAHAVDFFLGRNRNLRPQWRNPWER